LIPESATTSYSLALEDDGRVGPENLLEIGDLPRIGRDLQLEGEKLREALVHLEACDPNGGVVDPGYPDSAGDVLVLAPEQGAPNIESARHDEGHDAAPGSDGQERALRARGAAASVPAPWGGLDDASGW